jgi:hypothetical protein
MKYALLGLAAFALSLSAHADNKGAAPVPGARFQNLDRMIEELNLRPYFTDGMKARKRLKIAVFDNGFRGAQKEIGRSLPRNTKIHRGPVNQEGEEEIHGFYMARILWSLLSLGGEDDRYAPAEFHLYNTFGYSNLEAAVNDAIANKIDIVLYSQTWEYGGNFDGRGFINSLINRALDSGILWINNSGNVGNTTFNSPVQTTDDHWLDLPGRNHSLEVRCEKNPKNECLLRAVLSWNDFSDDVNQGSDKDLDFVLADDTLSIIQGSNLTQSKNPPAGQPGTSKYPREIITAKVKPGMYFLRVKNRSKNFGGKDRLRIVVDGDFLSMERHDAQENLLPPADNARVLTVGASDSERTCISTRSQKPELFTNSLVSLTREDNFKGTSNSAAMVAAGAAILLSREPGLGKDQIVQRTGSWQPPVQQPFGQGLPLQLLGFYPTGQNCFIPVNPAEADLPAHLARALRYSGTLVETTAGRKIFYDYDPIQLMPNFMRRMANDILVMTPQGPGIFQRTGAPMPEDYMELVQVPLGQRVCSGATQQPTFAIPAWSKLFRLPEIR